MLHTARLAPGQTSIRTPRTHSTRADAGPSWRAPFSELCDFSDRFGAIKVLDSTTGTVTLELTTWER